MHEYNDISLHFHYSFIVYYVIFLSKTLRKGRYERSSENNLLYLFVDGLCI